MIDPHVHLRDGSESRKESITHASEIASLCGFRALFDMPNTIPPLTSVEAITQRLAYGKSITKAKGIFYGVYGGVTSDSTQLKEILSLYRSEPSLVGLKMFATHSTGKMGLIGEEEQRGVYQTLTQEGYRGVLAVHCEKEELLEPTKATLSHSLARPPIAEIESVADQIRFMRESGFEGSLHICHLSTKGALELVLKAKEENMRVYCGVTSHHALLDESLSTVEGNLLKMNPPLRSRADQKALFEALVANQIDWIESDHAPHTLQDKRDGASGIPGFAGTLLLIRRLREEGVDEEQLHLLLGKRVASLYGIEAQITIPSEQQIKEALPIARDAYPWDPFDSIRE